MTLNELKKLAQATYPRPLKWQRARGVKNRPKATRLVEARFIGQGDTCLVEAILDGRQVRALHLTIGAYHTTPLGEALAFLAHILVHSGWDEARALEIPAALRAIQTPPGGPLQLGGLVLQWARSNELPFVLVSAEFDPVSHHVLSY